MKNLLFVFFSALAIVTVMISCSSNDDDTYDVEIVPYVRLNIIPSNTNEALLTPKQIARWGEAISYKEDEHLGFGFDAKQRDTSETTPALLLSCEFIMQRDENQHDPHKYTFKRVIGATDVVVERLIGVLANGDTIFTDPIYGDWGINRGYYADVDVRKIAYHVIDTIGYIPNKELRAIVKEATEKWKDGDFNAVNKIFNERFFITPINGKEWRALKAKDEQ
ncbi:MAG: hypothetical protein K5854_07475 [Prevotella sp.]|nr:hypothetical protein [Prevotella sp.]